MSTPNHVRKTRTRKAFILIIILFVIIYMIGIIGYKFIFKMTVADAIFNTSLTISNLGVGLHEKTAAEKIFTGVYAVISGVFFLSLVGAIIAYIFSLYIEDDLDCKTNESPKTTST